MKTINETFTDEEMLRLKTMKGSLTWREFILSIVTIAENKTKEGARK